MSLLKRVKDEPEPDHSRKRDYLFCDREKMNETRFWFRYGTDQELGLDLIHFHTLSGLNPVLSRSHSQSGPKVDLIRNFPEVSVE